MTTWTEIDNDREQDIKAYRTIMAIEENCVIIAQCLVYTEPDKDRADYVVIIPIEQWPLISNDIDTLIASNTTTMEQKKRRLS